MSKEIIKIEQTIEPIKKCRATRTSLEISLDTTIEEWLRIGESLNTIYKGNKWWIGDWLNFGERKYGHMYPQGMNTDYDYNTLANYKWVASRVESSRRRELLSFTHHYEVAKFEPKEQEKWLMKAEKEGWDRAEMRKQIRERIRKITPLPKRNINCQNNMELKDEIKKLIREYGVFGDAIIDEITDEIIKLVKKQCQIMSSNSKEEGNKRHVRLRLARSYRNCYK
jgi:hypothetical protein